MEKKTKYLKPTPIQQLEYLNKQGRLDFNPDYQRESVWTRSQKQLFIDSLLIEIDIPKLYFREVAKGKFEYEIVDGQQRLRAVLEFTDNRFPLSEDTDPIDGEIVAKKYFQDLSTPLQLKLFATSLDIVHLNKAYTDDDIDEMFLRLQNGTPLNAAEKRRAIGGNLGKVVQSLAKHKVFALTGFSNKRFAYEDTVAKTLHQLLAGGGSLTDIRPVSIKRTYENFASLSTTDKSVKKLKQAYEFINKAFKGKPNPKFKKYAMISLAYLVTDMMEHYDLSNYTSKFADSYLSFEKNRIENENLPEEKQDSELAAFTDAARADSIQDLKYRHDMYRDMVLKGVPELALKDGMRAFTREQRFFIYLKYIGKCASCGKECDQDDYHVDHIKPHSKGGATSIKNGQLLCPTCNLKKGSKVAESA